MNITISTNGYNIVSHGDIILYDDNSEMKLDIETDNRFSFSVIFKFIKDKEQGLKKEVDGNNIIFECINFDPLGTGTNLPISIATVGGKEWFLHFWCYVMGESGPRRIEYSILEKE